MDCLWLQRNINRLCGIILFICQTSERLETLLSLIVGTFIYKPTLCDLQTYRNDPFKLAKQVTLWNSKMCKIDHSQKCGLHYNIFENKTVQDQMYTHAVINQRFQKAVTNILRELGNPSSSSTIYMTMSSAKGSLRFMAPPAQLLYNIDVETHVNKTFQRIYNQSNPKSLNAVVFCSVQCILNVLEQANALDSTIQLKTRWLVIPTGCTTVAEFSKHSSALPSSDVITFDAVTCGTKFQGNRKSYIYKLESRGAIHKRRVGCIDTAGDVTLLDKLFSPIRNDLNGITFTVATIEWYPFVIKTINNGTVNYHGFCMDLLYELARILKFRYRIVEPEDGSFGEMVNGTWTGLVGLLAYKKVDLVAATLSPLLSRKEVIDLSTPYYHQKSAIILKMPDFKSNKWWTIIAPFRAEVHICILLSLVLSAVFLFVVEEVNPGNVWTDNSSTARLKRFLNLLWHNYGAITAKGGSDMPTTVSGRTILCCWWLFTVISAATYSGNLISFLTDWREKLPFTSLAEMVKQDTYKWGILGGGVLSSVFGDSKREEYKGVWLGMQDYPYKLSFNIEDHKRKCDTEEYAFLGSADLYNTWKSQDCAFRKIDDPFLMSYYTFGLQKNSSYTRIFSEQILRMNEAGLLQVLYNKWKPKVKCDAVKSAKQVDVLGLQSIFYALGIGITVASIVLSVELACWRKFTKKASSFRLSHACSVDTVEQSRDIMTALGNIDK